MAISPCAARVQARVVGAAGLKVLLDDERWFAEAACAAGIPDNVIARHIRGLRRELAALSALRRALQGLTITEKMLCTRLLRDSMSLEAIADLVNAMRKQKRVRNTPPSARQRVRPA